MPMISRLLTVLWLLATLASVDCSNIGTSWRNYQAFAALNADGTVTTWGRSASGGEAPPGLYNVKAIYSTAYAFAALKGDGTVEAWGISQLGGSGVPPSLSNVQHIVSNQGAFAAIKSDGTVATWGKFLGNDDVSVPPSPGLRDVQYIYSNFDAFVALKADGDVSAWGHLERGGSTPVDIRNVRAIYSSGRAFAALKADGTVTAWGQSDFGGEAPPGIHNVKAIYSTAYAFAALKGDGTVEAWGHPNNGGSGMPSDLINVRVVYSTGYAFAALKEDDSVVSWGASNHGGDIGNVALRNVKYVGSTFAWSSMGSSFAALKQDGSVVCWGNKTMGGKSPAELKDVVKIFSSAGAYAALRRNGTVFTWGSAKYGGDDPQVEGLRNIKYIVSNWFGFLAVSSNGTVYSWTGDTTTNYVDHPPTVRKDALVLGYTLSRSISLYPDAYLLQNNRVPFPTSQPTSYPTLNMGREIVLTAEHGMILDSAALSSGKGLIFTGSVYFSQIGTSFKKYYLSIFIFDTGFGPITRGQIVRFKMNGLPIHFKHGNATFDGCAPLKHVHEIGCTNKYVACAYNIEVGRTIISNEEGGSLVISAESSGVMGSTCTYDDYVIYVKYVLTAGNTQPTPLPTPEPTPLPTKGDTTIVNGLQLDINNLDIWKLLQISIATGVLLAGGAVYLCKLREKSKEAYQHPLPYAVTNLGMLGVELTSMIFLIVELFRYGYGESGGALVGFRFMKMIVGVLIVSGVYFPPSQSWLKSFMDFSQYLDWDHMIAESKVYFVVSAMSVVDLTFVVFLPWKNSRFATLSKGFPNLVLFRLVQVSLLVTSIVSFAIQLSYLSTATFVLERDLMFIINLILLSIKLLLITLEFFYKNHVLGATPTVLDDSGDDKGSSNTHDVESADNSEIFYQENPMMHNDPIPVDEENKPLLEKSVKRMQGKLSSLELEMSTVKAETDSMETKVEGVETKVAGVETKVAGVETKVEGVDEETRLLKSQMERENSALKEENSAFKARLETLERKVT